MRIRSCGIDFQVRMEGSGTPLVMLHGFGQDSSTFDAVVPLLAPRYRCIRIDLVGHGRTGKPSEVRAYTFDAIRLQLHGVIESLGVLDCVLLGYSMGGRIALDYAAHRGSALRGLILESAGLGPATEHEHREFSARDTALVDTIGGCTSVDAFFSWWDSLPLFVTQRKLPADIRARVEEARKRNTLRALALSVEGHGVHAMEDGRTFLRTFTVPGLYIAGREDIRYRTLAAELCREGIMEVCLLPGGHDVHLEEPIRYAGAVRGFLDALERKEVGDGDRSLGRG